MTSVSRQPPTDPPVDADGAADEAADEQPGQPAAWWDDPRLPWRGRPGRADMACWAAIALVGVYSLVALPLRPVILGLNPYALAAVTGSHTALAAIGARASQGDPWWPLGLAVSGLSTIKFDWIYWWAGRLWGHGIIQIFAGKSKRAARGAARAERFVAKAGGPAVFACYYIPFLPSPIVNALVGAARMRLWVFLLIDLAGALTSDAIFLVLGWTIGAPALRIVKLIGKYSWYLSIAIIAVLIIGWAIRKRRAARA